MGEEVLGALLLFHRQPDYFSQDLLNLLEATARQIAIVLNNAELFNLIRDQSEHLGSMLREQQIEASRSRAILEAVADGVLVTNAQGGINLFNASAERILDLKSAQVSGKSLDQFVSLFGRSAGDWMQTIRTFSQNPVAQKEALAYAEQIDLDNGRIVAVRLAPVYWRQEFLGTVSTFRDITHEVQVDRLKSEFVANVSHELRTPMTSIKGYVEIMLMGAAGTLNPQQVHFLNIVKSNTERLSVLVNDLLDVSRIEAGRVTLNFQPLDLREVAEDVIADLQRRAREENKPMRFNLDIPLDCRWPWAMWNAFARCLAIWSATVSCTRPRMAVWRCISPKSVKTSRWMLRIMALGLKKKNRSASLSASTAAKTRWCWLLPALGWAWPSLAP